jgi:hypothetical protein
VYAVVIWPVPVYAPVGFSALAVTVAPIAKYILTLPLNVVRVNGIGALVPEVNGMGVPVSEVVSLDTYVQFETGRLVPPPVGLSDAGMDSVSVTAEPP